MSRRFYLPSELNVAAVELAGSEAHHLLHVLRCQVGEKVCLFDGNGTEATARIAAVTKRTAELEIVATRSPEGPEHTQLILATAVPKGERFRWLVEKSTELGVNRLIPLQTSRHVVDPGSGKLEKMRQTVIAACKQCGRNRLMRIGEATPWSTFLENECRDQPVFVAHSDGQPSHEAVRPTGSATATSIVLAVGPEGGFTDAEIDEAVQLGATLVSLGPRILRIETAALAMATLFGQMAST